MNASPKPPEDGTPGGSQDDSLRAPAVAEMDWADELKRHDRWLRTVVFARLGDPSAVEDVMQETALAAIEQAAPLNDPAKSAPWLYRLAVRQALLYRRKAGRRRRLTQQFAETTQPTENASRDPDPLSWLLAEERRNMVRVALHRMASKDAEILLLKYTENWSYRELAARLNISESAVEARLHRARQRMRKALAMLTAEPKL